MAVLKAKSFLLRHLWHDRDIKEFGRVGKTFATGVGRVKQTSDNPFYGFIFTLLFFLVSVVAKTP